MANSETAGCTCVACENYRKAEKSRERLGLLPSLNVPHEEEKRAETVWQRDRIAALEAELAQARASRDGWERDALVYAQNAGKAEAERDAAVAQVAVLVEALDAAVSLLEGHRDTPPIQTRYHDAAAKARLALASLPAAANALLAKAAEVEGLRAHQEQAGGQG